MLINFGKIKVEFEPFVHSRQSAFHPRQSAASIEPAQAGTDPPPLVGTPPGSGPGRLGHRQENPLSGGVAESRGGYTSREEIEGSRPKAAKPARR